MVSSMPRPHFTPGKDLVPILQEAGWTPGPVWTGGKSRPHRNSIPDRPAHSQLLYRLNCPAHIQWIHGAISLGMNGTGREADHSLPHNSEVTNEWNSTCTTPYAFMAYIWRSLFEILHLYAPSTHITYLFWRSVILTANVQAKIWPALLNIV